MTSALTTVSIAGSTGSIGTQTLDVVAAEPERFEVVAIGANASVDLLVEQAHAVSPKVVAIADASRAAELEARLPPGTEVVAGPDALASIAGVADVCVNGVVGFAGLPVTLGALEAGKRLALANKESLIAAGPVVRAARSTPGAELVPVDSEHCAVHMCLRANDNRARVAGVVLTASGGPFRGRSRDELADVSAPVDWTTAQTWEFEPLDETAFPAVQLARSAGERGGTAPAAMNAANEVCVEAFLGGRLPFLGIVDTVAAVVDEHGFRERPTLSEVLETESAARQRAAELVERAQVA